MPSRWHNRSPESRRSGCVCITWTPVPVTLERHHGSEEPDRIARQLSLNGRRGEGAAVPVLLTAEAAGALHFRTVLWRSIPDGRGFPGPRRFFRWSFAAEGLRLNPDASQGVRT